MYVDSDQRVNKTVAEGDEMETRGLRVDGRRTYFREIPGSQLRRRESGHQISDRLEQSGGYLYPDEFDLRFGT